MMLNIMRCCLVMCLLTGCTAFTGPPKPTECKGSYRPINVEKQKGASFDSTGRMVSCEEVRAYGKRG